MSTITNEPAPGPEDHATHDGAAAAKPDEDGRLRAARWPLMVGGLVAGLAAFGIGEATYNIIPARQVLQNTMGHMLLAITPADKQVADTHDAALAFGILGAASAAAWGESGPLSSFDRVGGGGRSAGRGSGRGPGGRPRVRNAPRSKFLRHIYTDQEMLLSMLVHGVIWATCGAAAGLALGVGLGVGWRVLAFATVGGLVGSVLGRTCST